MHVDEGAGIKMKKKEVILKGFLNTLSVRGLVC